MLKTANKISFLVESQLPDFINEEYELFSKFVRKYYEQLELQGQPVDIITNLETYRDIDFYEKNVLKQSTTITGNLSSNADVINVVDAASFPKSGYIKIDDEICFYGNRTETSFLEVSRGVSGNTTLGDLYKSSTFVTTQSSTHVNGSTVQNISNLFLYALVKSFEDQYLADFPEAYLKEGVDKRTLIKNISSFYRSKGTDNSIKFLFKCLVEEDPNPEIAYPRDFTLKSSESNWIQSYALRVKIISGEPNNLIGKRIVQNVEGNYASAVVDNVKYSGTYDGEALYDIILNEQSVNGTFEKSLKTVLTSPIVGSLTVGDRVNVFSTMGWGKKGSFSIGLETFTFEEKNVNQFIIKTRSGTGSHQSGESVTYNLEVTSDDVKLQVFGILYGLQNVIESPYSNVGESVEISESGFLTDDIRINDTQNNLRWVDSTGVAAIADLNPNVSAIFEDGEGYYIASSGFPSHAIGTLPSDAQDQKLLKIIRKHPIQTTEVYKTLYRDIGVAVNGIPFLSYKDEEVVNSGALQSVAITSRGAGYNKPPFVLIDGVSDLARTKLAGQVVESVVIDTPGNYTAVPTIEILSGRNAQARAVVTNGEITSIVVENEGEYYSSAPEVRITDSAGRGRFATYRAVVTTAGTIDRFEKINGGSLYSQENVQVDIIAVGSGATGTASIRQWRKDKFYKNESSLDSENGYFFPNYVTNRGSGYAYYAAPSTIRSGDTGVNHSPIIGFAYDGNPIYGPFGHQNPLDSQSLIVRMTSSYSKNNVRSGGPLVSQYPIGTFIDDYTFVAEYGSLDQNNGRYCVTPDYPEGTYAYFVTLDNQNDPVFPYILGDNYYSLPVDSNYNSELSQDDIPKTARRLRTSGITRNGQSALAKIADVKRGSISSVSITGSTSNFSVGSELIIDDSDTDGFGASAEVSSVKGRQVSSIESQDIKSLFIELKTTAYLFDGDIITQSNTGATGQIVGDVFSSTKFALRNVIGSFNSTDVLSSSTKVISLFLNQNSSYTKGATLEFTDGLGAPVASGEVLETTTKQNTVKIKVLNGSFVPSDTFFLRSSDLINTTGSKILTTIELSEGLVIFDLKDNVAILKTADAHGVAETDIITIDINPDDATTTTTYYVRSRVYQEAVLKTPGITRVLTDDGIGKVSILNGGEDYTANTYNDIALSGGSGSGAKANVVVSAEGSVTSITLTDKGTGYQLFDILTIGDTALSKTDTTTPTVQINIDHIGLALSETVVNLDSNVGINPGDKLRIGNEIITVLSRVVNSTTSINVSRGTVPLNHFNGASVSSYNAGYVISVGTTVGDANILSYNPNTQKIVFTYDYGQTTSTINPIDLSTVFFDQEQRLAEVVSVEDPIRCFEFSLDNNSFTRNQLINIKEGYRYIFDSSHSSMSDVEFALSPSKNLNLKTLEAIRGNDTLDVKFGFGPRIATNNYNTKVESPFKKYFYFDRLNNVNSEEAFINVINDPLQGDKTALYITSDSIVYETGIPATNDGSGTINYISRSLFSVGEINDIRVINIGNDYKKVPSVLGIIPTNKATATSTISNGEVVGVSVKTNGSGYSKPIVYVDGDAKLKAIIDQGKITGIQIISSGSGYTTAPEVKIAESDVQCLINSDGIGVPRNVNVFNPGGSFHGDDTLSSTFRSNYILSLSNFDPDSFAIGETIVQRINGVEVARARITFFRSGRLSVDRVSGVFRKNKEIQGLARNKTAILKNISYTEFSPQITTYYDNQGYFQSDSGKVSDQNQRLTDSFYYQDYSYLVKSKTSIDTWRSLIKSTTHPAGFKVFGEVLLETSSNAAMNSNSTFTSTSIVQVWNPDVNKVSVISTKKNITQSIVLMDTLKVERGVGSVSKETFNTSEIISGEVYLTESFDGNFGDKGNLQGKTVFNIVDVNGNSIIPYNEQALTITLDGILQEPGIAYTVNNDKITFADPPIGPTTKDGQSVPGVLFYGRRFQFKSDTLNQKYLKKIKNIFQRSGTWIDAANQINQNRRFIQSETLGYIKSRYTSIPWTNLSEKCYRDIGLILDALEHDLRFGGNQKTLFAVEKYFNAGVLDYISGELEATIDAFDYAVRLCKLAARNWDYSDRQVSWTPGTNKVTLSNTDNVAIGMKVSAGRAFPAGTIITDIIDKRTIQVSNESVDITPDPSGNADMSFIWSGLNVGTYFDASTLIHKNKSSMITSTIDAINTKYLALAATNYDTKCARDLGLLVDAVVYSLKYGGNRKIVEFAESYFIDGDLNFIKNELNETVYAHKVLRDLMIAAMRNQGDVTDDSIRIDSSSPACAEVASSITTYIDIIESILEGGPDRVDTVEQNANSTGYWTTFISYSNYNILPDPLLLTELKECEEVASALDSLFENVRQTLTTGPETASLSYPDYINGENTIFELYYEDGTPVDTEANENLFIALSGVLQHDPAYTIDRTSVPNKVVFDTPPIWGQGENTKTVQEPLAVEKFFAHGVGNYLRCEIEKSGILDGSGGPFLILNSSNKKVQTVDDPRFAFVFIDGILQRDGVSYTITGPAIRFTRKIFRENNIEIILLYGRDIDQTVTLFDFQRNTYYNEIKLTCDAGSPNNFIDWVSWFNTSYDKFQVAYQKVGNVKKFIGNLKSYTTTDQTLVITLAGNNPDVDASNIFFAGDSNFSDEYELSGTTNTVEVVRDSDNDYRMQRNSGNWLYGTPRADESFYERKRLLANLNAKDVIRIDGEKEFRTINELPRYTNPKNYNAGEDVSNTFFGSVTTTNYNGDVSGVGLSVTCEIENGSVSALLWNKKDLQLLYDEGIIQPTTAYGYDSPPILHFIPVNQEGGGARAEVVVSNGQIIDIVLTKKGSGYTEPPRVVTARSYDIIKGTGRKIDTFHTLGIGTQIGQSSPVAVATFIDKLKGVDLPVVTIDPSVTIPSGYDVTLIIQKSIDTAPLFNVSREYRFFNPFAGSSSIAGPTTQVDADIMLIIEPKLVSDTIVVSLEIDITEYLEVGFSMWSPDLENLTFFNNINHWENSIYMDLGDIVAPSGDPVSEVQLAELEPYEITSDGSSSSAYPFNLGYSSINYYMSQLDTSDLPNIGNPSYLATGEVVYANTARFPSSGTILIGGEKISYTSKMADRFLNCTRGADGSPVSSHTVGDYLRNAL